MSWWRTVLSTLLGRVPVNARETSCSKVGMKGEISYPACPPAGADWKGRKQAGGVRRHYQRQACRPGQLASTLDLARFPGCC